MWFMGNTNNHGILFLASIKDHRIRIQTGIGAKVRLTDERAKSIIEDFH